MIQSAEDFDQSRYRKQALFAGLGADRDARLRAAAVAVVGCGALGSNVAMLLARAGVGRLHLIDRDLVELSNLHRQVGFTEEDAREGAPKAVALARRLERINSDVALESSVAHVSARNARELVGDAELVIDGTDNLATRFLINDLALELGLPWVYGGAVGEDARTQLFVPGSGPCLRCIVPEPPPPGALATCDTSGVLGPTASAAASFQAALALHVLAVPEDAPGLAGRLIRLRLWSPEAAVSTVESDPECPACVGGRRDFLAGEESDEASVICGKAAVQLLPRSARAVDLDLLAAGLERAGRVRLSPFMLRFEPEERPERLTVFPDGRALVEGTRSPNIARALYDRYLGK